MSKHQLSPAALPPAKRLQTLTFSEQRVHSVPPTTFDSALYDELILFIFSYLSWSDLCAVQSVNKNWSRLSGDNQLWKALYLKEYGRTRLRGARGFVARSDGREVKPLPGRAKVDDVKEWKWMFRISRNWRNGRCTVRQLEDTMDSTVKAHTSPKQTHILLAGTLTITASSQSSSTPSICLVGPSFQRHIIACPSQRHQLVHITALALDQSAPTSPHHLHLASFLSTGEFTIFSINHIAPSSSSRKLTYLPRAGVQNARTSPIIQAVYHHPLLITLSEAFHLSIYDLSNDTITHTQTLTSFTTYPPTSLVLSTPSPTTYKLVIAYAIPVYPAHWSVGATEIIISGPSSPLDPMGVVTTRTTRAFDVPQGWMDMNKFRSMREQWARKVERVADTQTDGKWVVLAPGDAPPPRLSPLPGISTSLPSTDPTSPSSSESTAPFLTSSSLHSSTSLQLYRLSLPASSSLPTPKLTFVRSLHGQIGPVSALALADGRCVSLGVNGSIWVWDLEGGTGAEVEGAFHEHRIEDEWQGEAQEQRRGTVIFDERRIISASVGARVEVRRFDV